MMKKMNVFRRLDMFGKPIAVKYQGSDTYRTTLGGCLSLMAFLVVVAYAIV